MNYKHHFIIGILFGIVLIYFLINYFKIQLTVFEMITGLVLAGFASLMPDIDTRASFMQNFLELGLSVIGFILIVLYYLNPLNQYIIFTAGIFAIIITMNLLKHRGITHTISAGAIMGTIILLLISWIYALFYFVGYLSHLIADMDLKL